ncbi:hypothetical protein [Paenibacillus sp. 2TAB19]|uniref:hypothetical protein n=1 Tax=Paenibacillus sp. 2TAB19 TaxID=3233003 RepID=UPI003F9B8C44
MNNTAGISLAKRIAWASIISTSLILAGCGQAENHAGHNKSEHEEADAVNAEGGEQSSGGHEGHGASSEGERQTESEAASDDAAVKWSFPSTGIAAGEKVKAEVSVFDKKGQPIDSFDMNHEKLMHLIVVSEDLSYFDHVHPEYKENGKFDVELVFPSGGAYKLYADFIPAGGSGEVIAANVNAAGDEAAASKLTPDEQLNKTVEGIEASLSLSSHQAGEEAELTFTFKDEQSKADITDLQPYLGAIGHVVIVSEDLGQYLHVHPVDDAGSGPQASFHTTFPEAGIYKIWGQFQRNGDTFVVPFTISVD